MITSPSRSHVWPDHFHSLERIDAERRHAWKCRRNRRMSSALLCSARWWCADARMGHGRRTHWMLIQHSNRWSLDIEWYDVSMATSWTYGRCMDDMGYEGWWCIIQTFKGKRSRYRDFGSRCPEIHLAVSVCSFSLRSYRTQRFILLWPVQSRVFELRSFDRVQCKCQRWTPSSCWLERMQRSKYRLGISSLNYWILLRECCHVHPPPSMEEN